MKVITFANFKSGGKSSIARLLAEKTQSSILNFDVKRDSKKYNAIATINIGEDKTIKRTKESLLISDDKVQQEIKPKNGHLICDLGGYFNSRILELESEVYILPSFDDYESISETMRTALFIVKNIPRANIIFILNGAFISDKTTRKEKLETFEEHKEVNGLQRFKTLYLPNSKLMRKLVDYGAKKSDLKNKFEQNIKYPKIDEFLSELSQTIENIS